jgi:hypothetical protein
MVAAVADLAAEVEFEEVLHIVEEDTGYTDSVLEEVQHDLEVHVAEEDSCLVVWAVNLDREGTGLSLLHAGVVVVFREDTLAVAIVAVDSVDQALIARDDLFYHH